MKLVNPETTAQNPPKNPVGSGGRLARPELKPVIEGKADGDDAQHQPDHGGVQEPEARPPHPDADGSRR
jgi:hypothetical protein